MKKKIPKPYSIPYYIDEVVGYRSEREAGHGIEDGYPPVVPELLLSILISVRAIRSFLGILTGAILFFLLKLLLVL